MNTKSTFLIFFLLILSIPIFSQKLTVVHNALFNKTEYYDSNNRLVYYSVPDIYTEEVTFFDANGNIIENITSISEKQEEKIKWNGKERKDRRNIKIKLLDTKQNDSNETPAGP